ncbi:Exo endo phos domain containing protein [Trichuris trichiura]|uniref:Exo endo phos domain containing protein n=1 Tax=Trichuris trichiura TaxID=36087 RepID=A0A077ZJ61_TRITR|nr:Exo endo phos domain containing protein [Trichuris trichiura]
MADLICLQEVDMRLFDNLWVPFLNECGLCGNFQRKGGDVAEGLAIFFNRDKFNFLKCENVVLSELVASRSSGFEYLDDCLKTNDEVQQLFMSRPQVLQVSVLSCSFNEDVIIIVANTHLHSRSPDSHIRLLQAAACIKHLESVVASVRSSFPDKHVSVLFCGDLNSTPEMSVHRLLTTGVVHKDDSGWRKGEFPGFDGLEIRTSLKMICLSDTSMLTNITEDFFGCLDYVYASREFQTVIVSDGWPAYQCLSAQASLYITVNPSVNFVDESLWSQVKRTNRPKHGTHHGLLVLNLLEYVLRRQLDPAEDPFERLLRDYCPMEAQITVLPKSSKAARDS